MAPVHFVLNQIPSTRTQELVRKCGLKMPLKPSNSVFQVQLLLKLEPEVTITAENKDHPNKTTSNYDILYPPHLYQKKRKRFFK